MDKPFIAWDGEGYNRDGKHFYSLFGNSLGARVHKDSLHWKDCINLLLDSPRDAIHVIYAGTYDVVMMFKDTPIVQRLLEGKPTRWRDFRILYRKGKYLQVSRLGVKGSTRTLYDVFTFFRVSFVNACKEYGVGTPELLEQVAAMKSQRNDFVGITSEIETYMGRELSLLVALCDNLRERLALANIYPAQWHGPGAVASAVLRTQKIRYAMGDYPDEFRLAAEAAYYGGRFEQFQRGTLIGDIYQYDIRSAYPAAMTLLPDLSEVVWTHYDKVANGLPIMPYALYYVDTQRVRDKGIGYVPHRTRHGTILFPPWVKGWYWGIELQHLSTTACSAVWVPSGPGLDARPFTFVAQAYKERAALKRANQPHQLALKLMLNSLYGKLAQSKGARYKDERWHYPTFHEIVWAGWITAYTRSRLAEAMHTVEPRCIIACETDSVFSTVPLPLPVGEGLGEWELAISDGLKYIQSGVSIILQDGAWKFKTRGFTLKRTEDEVAIWSEFLESTNPVMTITQTRFGTDPRQDSFGSWYTQERRLSLEGNPLEKRLHVDCAMCTKGLSYGKAMHPLVVTPVPFQESVGYKFAWRGPMEGFMGDLMDFEEDPVLSTDLRLG